MEKLTVNISPEEWGSLVTKYTPGSKKLTLANFTDGTVNVETDVNGSLTKRPGSTNYNAAALAAAPKDQFEAIFSDGARHLIVVQSGEFKYSTGDTLFNTVVNGTGYTSGANFQFVTTQDRVYGGNIANPPVVYDRVTSYGGVGYTAPQIKVMGAQAPSSAPTAGTPTSGGAVPNGSHTYKVTFLYYDFEESNGSPSSGVQTTGSGNNTVPLTDIPVGGYGVTARKIYRDNNDGVWLHVGTITNNTATTFSDTVAVGATPTPIPTDNGVPPSFGQISLWLDRNWLAQIPGDPYTLVYSDAGLPDIFPAANQILCNQEDPITAHVVYFDRLIVFNRRSMGQILGRTSDTFRYATIPSSIGCVDNRTIQIRVINGVPILIWLSDRGFYSYDGNAINYISDEIEDLVNFNIQQAVQQRNASSQTTFSGTAEDGISLTQIPGSITTKGYDEGQALAGTNPRRNWDDQGDWETAAPLTGSWTPISNTNTRTKDTDGTLRAPTGFAPVFSEGINAGLNFVAGVPSTIRLPITTPIAGDSTSSTTHYSQPTNTIGIAYPISRTRSGTLTDFSFYVEFFSLNPFVINYRVKVWSDAGGQPGTELFSSGLHSVSSPPGDTLISASPSVAMTAGQIYHIGFLIESGSGSQVLYAPRISSGLAGGPGKKLVGSLWSDITTSAFSRTPTSPTISYSFCANAVASNGTWTSAIYDTKSAFISPSLSMTQTGTYTAAAPCSGAATLAGQTVVEGSDLSDFAGGAQTSQIVNNASGATVLSISGKRYWRIRVSLTSTDDRVTPIVGVPVLTFATTATWESETIDCTAQVTTYNSLVTSSTVPAGTSVTTTIATSTSPTGPWTFVTFGSHVVRQYARVRLILTTDGPNTTSPSVSSVVFKWSITAKYDSVAIDTNVAPPAGWDIFLAQFATNGGTVLFEMRSAATIGALSSATYYTVTPSAFPTSVPILQHVQWRVTLTSSDNDVPVVDSVTVQWFISTVESVRAASIFADSRYYVALAQIQSSTNDVLLELDSDGKWRRLSGLGIATMSFFFNRPYIGMADSGQIRKFLDGATDAGAVITFDMRTKAVDFSSNQFDNNTEKVKVVGEVVIRGLNTGATIAVSYSVDNGVNFYPLVTDTGASSFTTASDSTPFYTRLRPVWDSGNPVSGRTIMYRILSADSFDVQIDGMKVSANVRRQPPVVTG